MINIPDSASVEDKIIAAIKTVFDPEIPVDIYALGLIYSVKYDAESQKAEIVMTLTSPGCFAAGMIPGQVEQAALRVAEVNSVHSELFCYFIVKITFLLYFFRC